MTSVRDLRLHGSMRLQAAGLDRREAQAQAEWLLAHVCECDRAALRLRAQDSPGRQRIAAYSLLLDRRAKGEPLQYITGSQAFMGYEFAVDPRVLIPRLDTEMLCVHALELLPADADVSVLDVGTGSGALAVSIALGRPRARVTASDISEDALDVARANAERLGARVRFVQS
ncbi:MAG: peptide chain release factor N(5)-glutamine methyltransferase, partial [Clostridia bacterium]|nr:peptide chain release factor N(5)-glutamine methyltransferase [Clostridia bacterium]